MSEISSRNLTIMFTDMKGFTSSTAAKSREDLIRLLKNHDDVLRPIFGQYKGTIIKTIGDAFLVIFDSPTDAVLCGLKIQEAVKEYNVHADTADRFIVRVAINTGEVHIKENDVFGEPVNIAARIEGVADGGDVCFSEAVYLAMNKNETPPVISLGYHHLKGIPYQVKIYKAVSSHEELKKLLDQKSIRPAQSSHASTKTLTHKSEPPTHRAMAPALEIKESQVVLRPVHISAPQPQVVHHKPTTHTVHHYYEAPPMRVVHKQTGFLSTLLVYGVMLMVIFAIYSWINLTNPSFFPTLFSSLDMYSRPILDFTAHILEITFEAIKQGP